MPMVKDLMTRNPVSCTPDADLKAVAKLMCDNSCGEIPVVESEQNKRTIGVITDRDITCRTVAQGKNPLELKAKDCMSSNPITVKQNADIQECVRLMEQHKIRRIPVVDEKGLLCGIVAQADIARKAPNKTAEVVREVSQPV